MGRVVDHGEMESVFIDLEAVAQLLDVASDAVFSRAVASQRILAKAGSEVVTDIPATGLSWLSGRLNDVVSNMRVALYGEGEAP